MIHLKGSPAAAPGRRPCESACRSTSRARRTSSLDELTDYAEDARPIGDERPTTARVTSRPDARPGSARPVVDIERFRGSRVLEVGPKYGNHARWIDASCGRPSSSSRTSHRTSACTRVGRRAREPAPLRLRRPPERDELLELEPFDLVFFLGVLYHSIHHLPLLGMLNRVTRPGGTMLFETTIDPRPDASAAALGTREREGEGDPVDAGAAARARLDRLAKVTRFTDYRPGSTEALFLCEKTDELPGPDATGAASFADVVTRCRPSPAVSYAPSSCRSLHAHPEGRARPGPRAPAPSPDAGSRCSPTCAG